MSPKSIEFEQVINRGCGLDVHKENVAGTIMDQQTKIRSCSWKLPGMEEQN